MNNTPLCTVFWHFFMISSLTTPHQYISIPILAPERINSIHPCLRRFLYLHAHTKASNRAGDLLSFVPFCRKTVAFPVFYAFQLPETMLCLAMSSAFVFLFRFEQKPDSNTETRRHTAFSSANSQQPPKSSKHQNKHLPKGIRNFSAFSPRLRLPNNQTLNIWEAASHL